MLFFFCSGRAPFCSPHSSPNLLPPPLRHCNQPVDKLHPGRGASELEQAEDFGTVPTLAVDDYRHELVAQLLFRPVRVHQHPVLIAGHVRVVAPPPHHGRRARDRKPAHAKRLGRCLSRAQDHLPVLIPLGGRKLRVPQGGEDGRPGHVERVAVKGNEEHIDEERPKRLGLWLLAVVVVLLLLHCLVTIVRPAAPRRWRVHNAQVVDRQQVRGVQQRVDATAERLRERRGRHARQKLRRAAGSELYVWDQQVVVPELPPTPLGARRQSACVIFEGAVVGYGSHRQDLGPDAADDGGVAAADDGATLCVRQRTRVDVDDATLGLGAAVCACRRVRVVGRGEVGE
ncbi:hypothetical protein ACKVWC_011609 [Pyricularia oryzae]